MLPGNIHRALMPPINFCGISPCDYDSATVVVLPVPYDSTSSYKTGSSEGPLSIILASKNMELFIHDLSVSPVELGILTLNDAAIDKSSSENTVKILSDIVGNLLSDGKFPVVLGGEHTISLGTFLGLNRFHKKIGVLHFDAHADRRDIFDHARICHATVIRRISEYTGKICSVGVRSISEEEILYLEDVEHKIFWSEDISSENSAKIAEEIQDYFGDIPVFLTIDIDVFDPAYTPATGTPVPDGLDWRSFWGLMNNLRSLNIVCFDVVEVRPLPPDVRTEFFAAKLIYRLLGLLFYEKLRKFTYKKNIFSR